MSAGDRDRWIRGLRATRAYTNDPIPDDLLKRILEAGRWTGSSLNSQPWTFVVLTEPEAKEALAATGKFSSHIASAAVAVVLVGEPNRGEFDLGRAAQNMMLTAWGEGIVSCPNGIPDTEGAAAALGLSPDEQPLVVLSFAYPARPRDPAARSAKEWSQRADRKPLEEIVERV